jgi:hypothetical protein
LKPVEKAKSESGTIALAGETPGAAAGEGMTCPNCGKWIEAGAAICTACGYSRRLARTLTTRVGTPEMMKVKGREEKPDKPPPPEIEAERSYRRAKERARIGRWDWVRLVAAVVWLAALVAMVMSAPTRWLERAANLRMPALLQPPRFDGLNASFMMLAFLVVGVTIAAIGVRVAAAMTNTEISRHFLWLRTGGVMAAALVLMEIGFSVDKAVLHLPWMLVLAGLAVVGVLAVLVFSWWLYDVRLSEGILLAIATIVSAVVGMYVAALAFAWLGNLVGIDPVIRVRNLFLH